MIHVGDIMSTLGLLSTSEGYPNICYRIVMGMFILKKNCGGI